MHRRPHAVSTRETRAARNACRDKARSFWLRLTCDGQVNSIRSLAARLAELAVNRFLRFVGLTFFYYPRVVIDTVRWRLRSSPTIVDVIEGERSFEGGTFAIFVMWQPDHTPWYVRNALDSL